MRNEYEAAHAIVRYVIEQLGLIGWMPDSVDSMNDEGEEKTPTAEAMLEEVFSMDDSVLYFTRKSDSRIAWIAMIPENGEDVIHDFPSRADGFTDEVELIMDAMDHLRCEGCGKVFHAKSALVLDDGNHCTFCGSDNLTSVITPPPKA